MTPTEFTEGLADVMGVAGTELATVDRSLAKHGLRQLARGRHRPDITLTEGVQLACAWAGAVSFTRAAHEVERLDRIIYQTEFLPGDPPLKGRRAEIDQDLTALFGAGARQLHGRVFLDMVEMLARQLSAGTFPEDRVTVAIRKGDTAFIEYRRDFRRQMVQFSHHKPITFGMPKQPPRVVIEVRIPGPVFRWIFDATEDS